MARNPWEHEDWPDDSSPGPHKFSVPSRKDITMRHGTPEQFPLIHRLRDQLEALNSDRPVNVCPHGIDMAAAACGKCMEEDEAKGAWLLAHGGA